MTLFGFASFSASSGRFIYFTLSSCLDLVGAVLKIGMR